jgi:transcriptional regulator with XRE-family HTH domain
MPVNLVNIIFGMKLRQARLEAGLSLSAFAAQCDLSPSYMTEIEKGRKYPRPDKIRRMAEVLGTDHGELVSVRLDPSLSYLESALNSSMLQRFPFEEFGWEADDLIHLLTRVPDRASALLHALVGLGRQYDLSEADFLRGALRSYQELHDNYFPDLEEAALACREQFGATHGLGESLPMDAAALEAVLRREYGYFIDDSVLQEDPHLSGCRMAYIASGRPRLLVNRRLHHNQIRFLFARELGYQFLGLTARSTTSMPLRIESFAQILNDFKAAYFGGVLLMPRAEMLLKALFGRPGWEPNRLHAHGSIAMPSHRRCCCTGGANSSRSSSASNCTSCGSITMATPSG